MVHSFRIANVKSCIHSSICVYSNIFDNFCSTASGLPRKAGKIPDIEKFDASFFGYNDIQANWSDVQFKICHETTFEAMIDAGIDPKRISDRTGIFYGFCYSDYKKACYESDPYTHKIVMEEDYSKVSIALGLKGPCLSFDSACASSFSALNDAVHAIKCGLIDTAIVAGVSVSTDRHIAVAFRLMGMASAEGESRCLDQDARGYAR